jgi:hypothetical protein
VKTTTLAAGLAAAALSSGLAACGGNGQSPSTTSAQATATATTPATPATTTPATPATTSASSTGPGLSRVELAAKAGVICSAATAEGRKLVAPADLTSNPRAAAAYFDKAVPSLDAETKALQALVPSAAVAAEWEAVLGAQAALDGLADGYREKADAGRPTSLADITELSTVGQTIAAAAIRLGVRCD